MSILGEDEVDQCQVESGSERGQSCTPLSIPLQRELRKGVTESSPFHLTKAVLKD